MTTEKIKIQGMNCAACVQAVKEALLSQGAKVKKVDMGEAEFEYDEASINRKDIISAIKEAGYQATNYSSNQQIIS